MINGTDSKWWLQNKLRLIQTNLSENDVNMNLDRLFTELTDVSANAYLINTGGMMAFYPTELDFHYKAPGLNRDLIAEVKQRCDKLGIRLICRFDFSKVHESFLDKHPDWFYESKEGEHINESGMVHTCVSGEYQRECTSLIIREVLKRYKPDGIFFNMFGFRTRDYSNHYYGICHCKGCQDGFREFADADLPEGVDPNDPLYLIYDRFKRHKVAELLERIHENVKSIDPEIAISTYTDSHVDIIKKESNTEIHRPLPFWLYSASENIASVRGSWDDKVISNVAINAVGLEYRHMGVSPHQNTIRLNQAMAGGSGLDFCIIGSYESYPDQSGLSAIRRAFGQHKKYEEIYSSLQSVASIVLVKPWPMIHEEQEREYLGLFKILKEEHVLFEVIRQDRLTARQKLFGQRYKCMILPDIRLMDTELFSLIRKLRGQLKMIFTGRPLSDSSMVEGVAEVWDIVYEQINTKARQSYVLTRGLRRFKERDWVFIDGNLAHMSSPSSTVLLHHIAPGRIGPPEKIGGFFQDNIPAALSFDETHTLFIPWYPGELYYTYGYEDHKFLFLDLVESVDDPDPRLTTDAPVQVEVFLDRCGSSGEQWLLQFINLSGFNGLTFFEPSSIQNITSNISIEKPPCMVKPLNDDSMNWSYEKGVLKISIDNLREYGAVLIQ